MSKLEIKRDGGKIYCPLTGSYHIETPEEKVRQEYIVKLVNEYGYSLYQMAQEIKVNNSQRGQGKAPILLFGDPKRTRTRARLPLLLSSARLRMFVSEKKTTIKAITMPLGRCKLLCNNQREGNKIL